MSSTRNKLIKILAENKDEFVSGQSLSEQLNVSRSAIWKHMNGLKKDGYVIEGVEKRGYRIISYPDNIVSENTIAWGLQTDWLGKTIIHKKSVTSTQTVAHQLALDGTTHGTIVIADEQTKGRGRVSRQWFSPGEQGIWMSLIIRPKILPYQAPQLTLLTATVLAEVFQQYCGITPQIKWPNDVLVNGKKISGILTEMQVEQDNVLYVIVGIGINVNQDAIQLQNKTAYKATSLRVETNKKWQLVPLIQQILQLFERKYDNYLLHGFDDVKKTWESYGFKINERLQIKSGRKVWHAVFRGIGEDGALLAESDDGTVEKIYSAEIAWF